MKKINILLLTLLLLLPSIVNATSIWEDASGQSPKPGGVSETDRSKWTNERGQIRVSLLDPNGNPKYVKDFSSGSYSPSSSNINIAQRIGHGTKMDYLSSGPVKWVKGNPSVTAITGLSSWSENSSNFSSQWSNNHYITDVMKEILINLVPDISKCITADNEIDLGVSGCEYLDDYFIMIEPIAEIAFKKNDGWYYFYGTGTELSYLLCNIAKEDEPSYNCESTKYPNENNITYNVMTMATRYLPKAAYITGKITQKYNNGYFNGKLKTWNDYDSSKCDISLRNLSPKCIMHAGVGVHVLWLKEYSKGTPTTNGRQCDVTDKRQFIKGQYCCEELKKDFNNLGSINSTNYEQYSDKYRFDRIVGASNTYTGSAGRVQNGIRYYWNTVYKEECEPNTPTTTNKCDNVYSIISQNPLQNNPTKLSCTYATNGNYEDSVVDNEDWQCIYDVKTNRPELADYYKGETQQPLVRNGHYGTYSYCNVYCVDKLEYTFPNHFEVEVGHHFTVNVNPYSGYGSEMSPVTLKNTRICKTDKINVDQFKQDYKRNDEYMATNWDLYQLASKKLDKYQDVLNNMNSNNGRLYSITKASPYTYTSCVNWLNEISNYTYATWINLGWSGSYWNITGNCWEGVSNISYGTNYVEYNETVSQNWGSELRCVTQRYRRYDTYTFSVYVSYTGWNQGYTYNQSHSFCANNYQSEMQNIMYPISNDKSYYWGKYTNYKEDRDATLESINACKDFTIKHQFSADVKLKLSNAFKVYDKEYELVVDASRSQNSSSNTYYDKNNNKLSSVTNDNITSHNCTGDTRCNSSQVSYPTIGYKQYEEKITNNYKLKDGIYNYVDKDGNSSHNIPTGKEYYTVGYSNVPIAFNTPFGNYEYNIEVTNLNHKFKDYIGNMTAGADGITRVSLVSRTVITNANLGYSCYYTVTKGFHPDEDPEIPPTPDPTPCDPNIEVCDPIPKPNPEDTIPTGIRIIYRPISLTDPFPYIEGTNRTPGSNWMGNETYITNNRNVSDNSVYNLIPMYEFELTPANLAAIRRYNTSHRYDDFNLECTDGQKCKSKFVREGAGTYFKYRSTNGGICINATDSTWESCRY